ncbi:MAG: hypothetical protein ACK5WW_04360 [Brevundimonas sp.]|jgi:hypothetical protein|nr:hypothetical protein [Brevundimonas sp.]MCZ8087650.1 hypothetical protein [Brevundimonas sp.]MCZ8194330.1 hypothetical protein [Brevundimonas sp.]
MDDREKRLQHAMVSFAMLGGLLVRSPYPHSTPSRAFEPLKPPKPPRD